MTALQETINNMPNEFVIVGGDFNLPEIKMDNGNISAPNMTLYNEFECIVNTFGFKQYLTQPTKHSKDYCGVFNAILPDCIENTTLVPK